MLAEGNSEVGACAHTLLSVMQREIPFSRSKGIDPDVYDVPFGDVGTYLDETARDVLGYYEPRVNVENVQLEFGQTGESDETRYTIELVDADLDEDGDLEIDDEDWDDE